MPDPAKEPALKAYRSIETWVMADGQRLNESAVKFDKEERIHISNLFVPLNSDLSIMFKIGARGPAVDAKGPAKLDLAVEVSLDGRPIHPLFIKRCNFDKIAITHFFKDDVDGEPAKFPLRVRPTPDSDDAMLPRLAEEVGQIRIDFYKTKLVKSTKGAGNVHKETVFPGITAYTSEISSNPFCIQPGPSEPCPSAERKSAYRPSEDYKLPGVKPFISFIYLYRERMDYTGEEDSKAGIAELLGKRPRPDASGAEVNKLTLELAGVKDSLKILQDKVDNLPDRDDHRSKRRETSSEWGLYGDHEEEEGGPVGGRMGSPLRPVGVAQVPLCPRSRYLKREYS